MPGIKDKIIEQTLDFCQPRTDRTISREDGRQIIENISGFFQILANWQATTTPDNPHTYLHTEQDNINHKERAANE